jgi:exodeoxyribonuclease VII small subunit
MTEPGTNSTEMSQGLNDQSLSYEQARDELISVVHRLESGGVPLAESLALWERGEQLATLCQSLLDGARAKVAAARSAPADSANSSEPEPLS